MTRLVSKFDYFRILSMARSTFIRLGKGKKVTAILRRWWFKGLGTPEVQIASVPVPALIGNKVASSNLKGEPLPIGQNPLKLLEIGA